MCIDANLSPTRAATPLQLGAGPSWFTEAPSIAQPSQGGQVFRTFNATGLHSVDQRKLLKFLEKVKNEQKIE